MAAFTKQDADDIEELMDAVNSIPAELDDLDSYEPEAEKPSTGKD